MNVGHAVQCANWHASGQVPNDTLPSVPIGSLNRYMANEFKEALEWHMAEHDTKIVDLVKGCGVTRDVVNKILTPSRPTSSTAVENAILIAAFYGKTVNQFVSKQKVSDAERARNLFDLLDPEDVAILESQIQSLLALRARQRAERLRQGQSPGQSHQEHSKA